MGTISDCPNALLQAKTEMLDNLLEIEVAYNMLRDKATEGKTKNPIDANYEKLNTDIKVKILAYIYYAILMYFMIVGFNFDDKSLHVFIISGSC